MVNSPAILHVNPEHGGLRLAVLVSLIIGAVVGFVAIRQLLGLLNNGFPDYTILVSCVGSLIIALVTIWVVETVLKRTWHSGQRLELDGQGITLFNKVENDLSIKWQGDVLGRHWTFSLSGFNRAARESRLPKNWRCLASMIQKGDKRIVVYTYVPKEKGEQFLNREIGDLEYHPIDPLDVYDSSVRIRMGPAFRPEIPATVLTGPNGRYWLAEKRRWENGFELSIEDYETFVSYVSENLKEALP